MRKNLYFHKVIKRENIANKMLLSFFDNLASFPRLMLEVFIRKNFGERYFNLASALSVALITALIPVVLHSLPSAEGPFIVKYATWYVFIGLFLYHSLQRSREIQKSGSSFDFTKFSRYAGDINPWFYKIQLSNTAPSSRTIETLYEPAVFFLGGVVLWICGQSIGLLICVSSIFYSMSYVAAYSYGDNFVLDYIDEIIFNEEMQRAFVDEMEPEDTRGVRFYARKPSVKSLRQKVADAMLEDDQDDAAEIK